jgi:hypothetical protein
MIKVNILIYIIGILASLLLIAGVGPTLYQEITWHKKFKTFYGFNPPLDKRLKRSRMRIPYLQPLVDVMLEEQLNSLLRNSFSESKEENIRKLIELKKIISITEWYGFTTMIDLKDLTDVL